MSGSEEGTATKSGASNRPRRNAATDAGKRCFGFWLHLSRKRGSAAVRAGARPIRQVARTRPVSKTAGDQFRQNARQYRLERPPSGRGNRRLLLHVCKTGPHRAFATCIKKHYRSTAPRVGVAPRRYL